MCHHVHVSLSDEEKRDAKKLSGMLNPVYAAIALAVIAVVTITAALPRNELVATAFVPATR